jgi:hypothetical protein
MEISILEASKRLKVGRSTIYKKIASGELSKTPSGKIDTSELFRVFGSSPKTVSQDTPKTPVDNFQDIEKHPLYKAQADKVRMLEEALNQACDREQWQRGQIEKLTDTIKLLEAPRTPAPPTQAERLKGFIDRVLGR